MEDKDKEAMANAFDARTVGIIDYVNYQILDSVQSRLGDDGQDEFYWQTSAISDMLNHLTTQWKENASTKSIAYTEHFNTTYEEDMFAFRNTTYCYMNLAINMLDEALGREKKKADLDFADYGLSTIIINPILVLAIDMLHTVAENYKKKVLEVA